uniref:Cullin family profile domain-containing protein n=1 Tax=Phaeomonas parva TaxID=124430 RepID=A0A6U4JV64_9STRA|mmetsp:Transcript_44983/g.140920  ORF Transcript_44983/g.140920 Transcript_44983/m.140920 type:complete len:769 (+) Transcript_44983:394-2700(+)
MSETKKKKFVIQPYQARKPLSRAEALDIWQSLSDAIDQIYQKRSSQLSFEILYRSAYNLVLDKHGELLYSGVRESLTRRFVAIGEAVAKTPDAQLLETLAARWADQKVILSTVKDILMYMDRTYAVPHKVKTTYEMGLEVFLDRVIHHQKVRERLRTLLLASVKAERLGQLVDRPLLKTILTMLVEAGVGSTAVYEAEFEEQFLHETRVFYRQESLDFLSHNTADAYLAKAEERITEELDRADGVLHAGTREKVAYIVEHELIDAHAQALTDMENSGCVFMFENRRIEDLRRMFRLFSRVPQSLEHIKRKLYEHVTRIGRQHVTDQERTKDPVQFVTNLLDMREQYEHIVAAAFNAEPKFKKVLREAFENFMNMDANCAKYMALYIDDLLKSKLRGLSETEVDLRLDRVIILFRYLQDKDVFEEFYKQYLGKRLLSGKSLSDEAEKAMVVKLKSECGYQFTSKLEGMFNDMQISRDTLEQFKGSGSWQAFKQTSAIDFDCNILTQGHWPNQLSEPCRLPGPVKALCDAFEGYYLQHHTGRKVYWQCNMGRADIKAVFRPSESVVKRHDLDVSTYQMCILVLFNDADALSFEDIRARTGIPDAELRRHLISLSTPKHRILKREKPSAGAAAGGGDNAANPNPKGSGKEKNEIFRFNEAYTSRHKRVRVPLVSIKGSAPGDGAGAADKAGGGLPDYVESRRKHLVEAHVVRIMKARKTLRHNELVAEVTRQLAQRFSPDPVLIKKRVESLIEREYLQRDTDDRRIYHYLA